MDIPKDLLPEKKEFQKTYSVRKTPMSDAKIALAQRVLKPEYGDLNVSEAFRFLLDYVLAVMCPAELRQINDQFKKPQTKKMAKQKQSSTKLITQK